MLKKTRHKITFKNRNSFLCDAKYDGSTSVAWQWKDVTCINCLKLRKKGKKNARIEQDHNRESERGCLLA
jgi:hypothetical protein